MPIFNITYSTSNYYSNQVRGAMIELMVLPENNQAQKCHFHQITNSLEIVPQFSESLFGASLIRFRIPMKFCSFSVDVKATIEKDEMNPFGMDQTDPRRQDLELNDHSFKIDQFRYLNFSEFTKPVKENIPKEVMRLKDEEPFLYMQRINHWVYAHLKFKTGVTNTQTKIDDVLMIMAGVCQDFAHLFITIMRANGLPARYVSGYINQGKSFTGDAALHAWAEVFLPGTGWIGFDPSNNLLVNVNYLKIGHGLDYSDCMPINGVIIAGGNGFTEYSVKVVEQQIQ